LLRGRIELTRAAFQRTLAAIQLSDSLTDRLAQALDFVAQRRRLEVRADGVDLGSPIRRVSADRRPMAIPWPVQAVTRK
jgi:hypothetical protein